VNPLLLVKLPPVETRNKPFVRVSVVAVTAPEPVTSRIVAMLVPLFTISVLKPEVDAPLMVCKAAPLKFIVFAVVNEKVPLLV
jgi:hypothetical protein